jgi:hypothetical protein
VGVRRGHPQLPHRLLGRVSGGPRPLEPHDLLRIDQDPGGYRAVCTCVWQPWTSAADPDAAAHLHRAHLRHMDLQERLLTMAVHPLLVEWINDLRARQRRQEPER